MVLFNDLLGSDYGTEDFSVFLYSLIKMMKWENILELGTGWGVSSFWIAQALKENGCGQLISLDDGRLQPNDLMKKVKKRLNSKFPKIQAKSYFSYLEEMKKELGFSKEIIFKEKTIDFADKKIFGTRKLDMVFSDFFHSPEVILILLTRLLPKMNSGGAIFIDGGISELNNYLLLEKLINAFNKGKIPHYLLKRIPHPEALEKSIQNFHLELVPIVEKKSRKQNNTAWIRIDGKKNLPFI